MNRSPDPQQPVPEIAVAIIVSKVPRLRFKCECVSRWRVRAQLRARLLERLRRGPTEWRVKRTHIPTWLVSMKTEGRETSINLVRDRHQHDFWVVTVAAMAETFPFSRHVVVPDNFIPDLRAVCLCVHEAVASMPGVQSPHWYFEWREYRSKSTWTPDELPWNT